MRITLGQLASLIDERYLKRGEAYFADGMVELVSITDKKVAAKCAGSRIYTTHLSLDGGALSGGCSCPAVENFGPCKHMAAVGYAVMRRKTYAPSEDYLGQKRDEDRFAKMLQGKRKAELIEIILQMVAENPDGYGYWDDEE